MITEPFNEAFVLVLRQSLGLEEKVLFTSLLRAGLQTKIAVEQNDIDFSRSS